MLSDAVISERAYRAGDVASVKAGLQVVKVLVASLAITRHCAEKVLAQCAEDLRRLTRQLGCIDAVHND